LHNTALVYMTSYMSSIGGVPQTAALWIGTSCLAVFILLLPLMGLLSDYVGRRPLLITSCIGYAVLGYPLFWITTSGYIELAAVAQLLMVLLYVLCGRLPGILCRDLSDPGALHRIVDRLQYRRRDIRRVRAVYRHFSAAGNRQ
jgi:MFS family permease